MGIKLKKSVKILTLLIFVITLIFNIFNYVTFLHSEQVPLEIKKMSNKENRDSDVVYSYDSFKISQINFTISLYNDDNTIKKSENIGNYVLNNSINIYEINPLNLINKICGNNRDSGIINLSLLEDNCIYIDCYSKIYRSKNVTVSKINLFDSIIVFDDYKFQYFESNNVEINKPFLLAEGISKEDSSKLRIYLSIQ